MPTLDEIRRWARGEAIDGLPTVSPRTEAERPEQPRTGSASDFTGHGGRYRLNGDGTDAIVQFGKLFRGEPLSVIVTTARGRKYLAWIVSQQFDEALKAACRHQMELHKRAK